MKKLSAKSYTRVTLALDIIGKIQSGPFQGFHELGTIKHLIGLYDIITVEESLDMGIVCDAPSVPVDSGNSCWTACNLLKQRFGITENVLITIQKNIPVKGGLAGGSANAATTIALLCELWKIDISSNDLIALSRGAGQDVPFYFAGPTAFDSEAGQVLTPLSNSLRFDFILVTPDFGVSTKEAYGNIDYAAVSRNVEETRDMLLAIKENNRAGVIRNMHNDFEHSVFPRYPKLEFIKSKLMENGCEAACMTGSGSTVIGILQSYKDFDRIKNRLGYPCILASSTHGRRLSSLSHAKTPVQDKPFHPRTGSFRWNSKQELCDYFNREYGLTRKIVEAEINEVLKTFQLRQGRAVATSELWQKVGTTLEKKINDLAIEK